jgi:DNA-directed RNA polymerase specialized sigma24 family protein
MRDSAEEATEGLAAVILGPSELALFENLYSAYAERARRAAMGVVHDVDLAADAVHTAFLEMLRWVVAGGRWHDPAEAEATVVRNTHWAALNLLRRRRSRQELPLEPSHVAGEDADWARAEARALCEHLIAGLVPRRSSASLWARSSRVSIVP